MAAKRRRRPTLALPWERGAGALRTLFSGRRALPVGLALLLGVLAYGAFLLGTHRDRVRQTRAAIQEIKRAAHAFTVDMGRCPHDASELAHPPKSGVHYLSEVPRDAWGRPFFFRCSFGDHTQLEVVSAGPSGSFFKDDNVK